MSLSHIFYYFFVHPIINGIFFLLVLFFIYLAGNRIGYLLRDGCWLVRGYISYSVNNVDYNLDNSPFI